MLTIYNEKGDRKQIHPIDLSAWSKAGWSTQKRSNDNSILPTVLESDKSEELVVSPNIKVKINAGNLEDLTSLDYVGIATAKQIISERKKQLFEDIEDLKKRTSLSRGSWDNLTENIIF